MDHKWLADAILATADAGTLEAVLAAECKAADPISGLGLADWVEDQGVTHSPFKVGEKVFIFTVTLYYVGEVTEVGLGFVRLKDCSWVHWTGRIGSLFASCDLRRQHGNRMPRTEYIGDYTLFVQSGVGFRRWDGELPKESL